jgi:hypothetical protein
LIDLELEMIKTFHWSLHEIDETDTMSLFDLFRHITGHDPDMKFVDQVGFLDM